MGHYRSEMYTEAELQREELEAQQRRERLVNGIRDAIDKRGVEHVLADIIEQVGGLRWRYERTGS